MNKKAKEYIDKLQLKVHPEGGYFSEVYRSEELIKVNHLSERYNSSRSFSTSIYYMLEGNQFSSFHRLKSDELWHFYDGTALTIIVINEKGLLDKIRLGNDLNKRETFQTVIKKNSWFAAELIDKNSFALIGCTVSPGFDFDDFELGNRNDLVKEFPRYEEVIVKFTR